MSPINCCGIGFREPTSGLGFRVWGLGFRVWGLGFRVWGPCVASVGAC